LARRFVRNAPLRQGQRRKSVWFFVSPALQSNGGSATLIGTLNAAALALRPFTVVRSRLHIHVLSDQTAAAEVQIGAFGIAVVSDQAAAVGVTAVPIPITDLGSDLWFVHQLLMAAQMSGSINARRGVGFTIDSKAMRKVAIGEDLAFVVENSSVGQGQTLLIAGRLLVKIA